MEGNFPLLTTLFSRFSPIWKAQ